MQLIYTIIIDILDWFLTKFKILRFKSRNKNRKFGLGKYNDFEFPSSFFKKLNPEDQEVIEKLKE